jgi:hypothetical protein
VNPPPDRQFERGNLPQEKSELAVCLRRVGQKRTARTGVALRHCGELTPDDTDHGRQRAVLGRSEKIKRLTLDRREAEDLSNAA